jgi:hypothetical protein
VASDSFPSSATSDGVVDGFGHPIPACRIVAVTLPPALDSEFMVSRIAATGAPVVAGDGRPVRQRLQA